MTMTTIIGRGHSGTRAIAKTLRLSGTYMGEWLNASSDLLPGWPIFDAAKIIARYIKWNGDVSWDFSALHTMPIPDDFQWLVHEYLKPFKGCTAPYQGWKIPETTLIFPWLVRMFPDIQYIYWVRHPQDCVLDKHITDDIHEFGLAYPPPAYFSSIMPAAGHSEEWWMRVKRAISWKYQYDIVQATPKPKWWYQMRFEDFVLKQEETLVALEAKIDMKLVRLPVQKEAVGRYLKQEGVSFFDFLRGPMRELGYLPVDAQT
jgi:Sulfotransferase family